MKVDILASGSGGNCIALRSSEATILVDVGIAKTKVEKRLLDVGIRPDSIRAILITHAHSDHVKGLPLANKYKIPVYAADGEWKSLKGVEEDLQRPIKAGSDINIDDWYIESFKTHHDAYSPLGYVLSDYKGQKCSVCLDTGHVDQNMLATMEFSNIYIIEANHEPNMVEVSDYPNSVKARILSHIGHLSNEQTAETLSKLISGLGEQIYLTHLSSNNNMPALAEMTVKRALARKGFKVGTHYHLEVI
ncbi:Phosphoribosyl 1,2-cyclic phosphodiesterase [Bacillus sp. OV166]|uniref:MBL fold metallo-hydrolase n=1 Tax=Bacillus sp. OV166 TaxID=1882763 RepID=UPI000A2AECA4|nr:MBL fold metallo-hydrolase [Bacillus sp. OV166]SMQ75873.1 Phosphoribosyl 1,2-cyclic phosphodiesterase [Bacillus sp. OV166]